MQCIPIQQSRKFWKELMVQSPTALKKLKFPACAFHELEKNPKVLHGLIQGKKFI